MSEQTTNESPSPSAACSPPSVTPRCDLLERTTLNPADWMALARTLENEAEFYKAALSLVPIVDAKQMVRLYNQGYHAGHEDTVEACFTPIHGTEMDTYHADVVAGILQENVNVHTPLPVRASSETEVKP